MISGCNFTPPPNIIMISGCTFTPPPKIIPLERNNFTRKALKLGLNSFFTLLWIDWEVNTTIIIVLLFLLMSLCVTHGATL